MGLVFSDPAPQSLKARPFHNWLVLLSTTALVTWVPSSSSPLILCCSALYLGVQDGCCMCRCHLGTQCPPEHSCSLVFKKSQWEGSRASPQNPHFLPGKPVLVSSLLAEVHVLLQWLWLMTKVICRFIFSREFKAVIIRCGFSRRSINLAATCSSLLWLWGGSAQHHTENTNRVAQFKNKLIICCCSCKYWNVSKDEAGEIHTLFMTATGSPDWLSRSESSVPAAKEVQSSRLEPIIDASL